VYYDRFENFTRLENKRHLEFKYDYYGSLRYIKTQLLAFPKWDERRAINIIFTISEKGKNPYDSKTVYVKTSSSGANFLFEDNTIIRISLSEFDLGNNTSGDIKTIPFKGDKNALYEHLRNSKLKAIRIRISGENYDFDLVESDKTFFMDFIECYENYSVK
jgi:hypothetical protein